MTNDVTPHFSRKILTLSLIFLLANLGIYGLRFFTDQSSELNSVAPKLVSATIQEVEVKSPYDQAYRPAQVGQEVYAGSLVKTSEKEFAELVLGSNTIRLDEQTEIRLISNDPSGTNTYLPDVPRLEIELVAGSIWVNAFDLINIRSPRSTVQLHHSVAMLTYQIPINRLMVFTGAADLSLLDANGRLLSDFVVPLGNQVTFVDMQITDTYAVLKPSKLKKELKMSPIAEEVLADEWVARNANDFGNSRKASADNLINSQWAYQLRSNYEKALSYLTFVPEARRSLAIEQAKTMLNYILGAVQEGKDTAQAESLIEQFKSFVVQRKNDPRIENLIVETLFGIEYTRAGTPAYLLKDALIQMVAEREGPHVYGIYLADVRRALYDKDTTASEKAAEKWLASWKEKLDRNNVTGLNRQAQILNHTILSYINIATTALLDTFDASGMMTLTDAKDVEDARYEIITNRLQVAASLISSYRYILAKQYLKNTYLSMNIENLSPDLASTQVFLENGKLLAQRIEYAEAVLHGSAQAIDETKFRAYFQTIKRDEALSADLRKFFALDQQETEIETQVQTPTAAQVASRFLDARINVNFADINLRPESDGFYYDIKNARLMDRGMSTKTLFFDATYDYGSNSVMDVVAMGITYKGAFTLSDIVMLLKQGGDPTSKPSIPKADKGVELLITDQEKIAAQEGQAIAQDVARQLAYNQLAAYGIIIPEVKYDIDVLDTLNLNLFHIKQAIIPRPDQDIGISISFDFSSVTEEVRNVVSNEGVTLIEKTSAKDLPTLVLGKVLEVEKELKAIGDFNTFTRQNNLFVVPEDIFYTPSGLISFNNLQLLTLGLKVSGLYDPITKKFVSVIHPLFSAQEIDVKEYFKKLADQTVIDYMQTKGFTLSAAQIESKFPFSTITINQLDLGGYIYSFGLDMVNGKAMQVRQEGSELIIDELTLEDLKAQS